MIKYTSLLLPLICSRKLADGLVDVICVTHSWLQSSVHIVWPPCSFDLNVFRISTSLGDDIGSLTSNWKWAHKLIGMRLIHSACNSGQQGAVSDICTSGCGTTAGVAGMILEVWLVTESELGLTGMRLIYSLHVVDNKELFLTLSRYSTCQKNLPFHYRFTVIFFNT